MYKINHIYNLDCIKGLKLLPDGCVHTCVTSPPYWGLRDYGVDGQIGLEETPEKFIKKMVKVFREVKRVLRDDGTLWINIGDSYAANSKNRSIEQATAKSNLNGGLKSQQQNLKQQSKIVGNLKPKDLVGIPWMLAFALRKDGWYLRQDIIWQKPNPMPESCTDRCTKSHEYIFLLSKSPRYYYDALAIATPYADKTYTTFGIEMKGAGDQTGLVMAENRANTMLIHKPKQWKHLPANYYNSSYNRDTTPDYKQYAKKSKGRQPRPDDSRGGNQGSGDIPPISDMGLANKRSVWTIATQGFKEAHFATFPEALAADCVKAGCPVDGLVLDIFMGAGTTGLVAQKLNRNYIGFELNPAYIKIAEKRFELELGMFQRKATEV